MSKQEQNQRFRERHPDYFKKYWRDRHPIPNKNRERIVLTEDEVKELLAQKPRRKSDDEVTATRLYQRVWERNNREHVRAYRRAYYERTAERRKKYYEEHKEQRRAYARKMYRIHKAEAIAMASGTLRPGAGTRTAPQGEQQKILPGT